MSTEQAVQIRVKTIVGDFIVTLKMEDARKVLARVIPSTDALSPEEVRNLLAVTWLSGAMKRDKGIVGTEDAPYVNYVTDTGDWVTVRSTAVMAMEARLVPVAKGMGFGSVPPVESPLDV